MSSGSALGSPTSGGFLRGRHPHLRPEPAQLTPFDEEEQRLFSELTAEFSYPAEDRFSCLDPGLFPCLEMREHPLEPGLGSWTLTGPSSEIKTGGHLNVDTLPARRTSWSGAERVRLGAREGPSMRMDLFVWNISKHFLSESND